MARKKLSMRKVREVARLKASRLSNRQIAQSCRIARSTVADYVRRLAAAGLSWPLPPGMSDEELDVRLFRRPHVRGPDPCRPVPEWAEIHKELRRKAVTLRLLWEEYRAMYPEGYGYSQFCEHHRRWAKTIDVSLHQTYRAGEKLFVDYAGMTMPVTDPATGEVRHAQIFVATLGASHYIYAEATRTQQLPDWIDSHIRTYEHLGGAPDITSPDNLKSGVTKACRYDPDVNRTYQDMARFYGTAVIPRRPRKPRDGAKVETGVQIVERQILARLRDRTFFSLHELNRAIRELLERVNKQPFQKLDYSRQKLFEELDKPALKPLPPSRYEFAEFLTPTVNIDYHIDVLGHYYSVPYQLRGEKVDARLTVRMVEVLYKNKRVASHVRDDRKGRYTTDPAHMPKAHREHLEWTPSRIIRWAGKIGPSCAKSAQQIIESRDHPEQGYRACMGILRLSTSYESSRVEAACRRALALNVCSYRSIKSILKTGKDREALPTDEPVVRVCPNHHRNVRGADYYAPQGTTERPAGEEKGGRYDVSADRHA
jgi:transposase